MLPDQDKTGFTVVKRFVTPARYVMAKFAAAFGQIFIDRMLMRIRMAIGAACRFKAEILAFVRRSYMGFSVA